jgi:hypothetical protein
MVIQIERISAQSIHRSIYQCAEPQCTVTATWALVDRAMPTANLLNLGERACCVEHIAVTYLSLRGAHLIAQALDGTIELRPEAGADRRRRRKRRSIASLPDVLEAGAIARSAG